MKVVAISDTHGSHADLVIPPADLLIHCGDFTNLGTLKEFEDFNNWLGTLPHKEKVIIAGNHDLLFERYPLPHISAWIGGLNARYLQDQSIHINGVHIYGSPWTPQFMEWAFMYDRSEDFARERWERIPEKVDILITHGPPRGILDRPHQGVPEGCTDLLNRVNQVKPVYHVFGHIHEGYGWVAKEDTTFINAALSSQWKRHNKTPVEFEI